MGLGDAPCTDNGGQAGLGDGGDCAEAGSDKSDPNLDVTHDKTTFQMYGEWKRCNRRATAEKG